MGLAVGTIVGAIEKVGAEVDVGVDVGATVGTALQPHSSHQSFSVTTTPQSEEMFEPPCEVDVLAPDDHPPVDEPETEDCPPVDEPESEDCPPVDEPESEEYPLDLVNLRDEEEPEVEEPEVKDLLDPRLEPELPTYEEYDSTDWPSS